jgi:hypothetical protein
VEIGFQGGQWSVLSLLAGRVGQGKRWIPGCAGSSLEKSPKWATFAFWV